MTCAASPMTLSASATVKNLLASSATCLVLAMVSLLLLTVPFVPLRVVQSSSPGMLPTLMLRINANFPSSARVVVLIVSFGRVLVVMLVNTPKTFKFLPKLVAVVPVSVSSNGLLTPNLIVTATVLTLSLTFPPVRLVL